jgi:hypothetical protein
MKKLYTVLLFCAFSLTLWAQQLPALILEQYPELATLEEEHYREDNTRILEEYSLIATRFSEWIADEQAWIYDDSSHYTYNTVGVYDKITNYNFNENNWEPSTRNSYYYNDDQLTTLYTVQSWVNGEWGQAEGDFQDLRSYDDLGNQLELIYQNWTQGEWKTYLRNSNTYYPGTNLIETELFQGTSNPSGELMNETYNVYEDYNANGDWIRQTRQFWDPYALEWGNKTVFERVFNSEDQVILSVESEELNDILIPGLQTIYTYNNEGLIQQRLTQLWDNSQEEWYDLRQVIYEYDENGNTTLYESYFLDSYSQELSASIRIEFTYFESGELEQYVVLVSNGMELVNDSRFTFTYYEDIFERQTYLRELWNTELDAWENDIFGEYFYNLFVDTKEQLLEEEQAIKLFPNPATGQVNIQLNNLVLTGHGIRAQLFNQQGQLVRQYTLGQDNHQLDISGLPVGSYWLKVSNGQYSAVKKLVVR